MDPEELRIHTLLMLTPGKSYISLDGYKLYLLIPNGMMCLIGPDFTKMNETEINKFVQDALEP